MFNRVIITFAPYVRHHERTIVLHVVGDPVPLAEALRDGCFTVAYETEEVTKTLVEL